jgi:hypothetical protein
LAAGSPCINVPFDKGEPTVGLKFGCQLHDAGLREVDTNKRLTRYLTLDRRFDQTAVAGPKLDDAIGGAKSV